MRIGLNGRFVAARTTGVQRFAREVSRRLLETGDCVMLLPRHARPAEAVPPGTQFTTGRLRGHAWEQLELPAQARAAQCDVVLHLPGTMPAGGGPNVAVMHDVLPITNPHWFSRRFAAWYRYAVGRNARHAACIITVSSWSAEQIRSALRLRPERVHVVLQGLAPFDHPATAEQQAVVRARFQLPERYLLSLGWGDPRKNVQFLLRVLDAWRRVDGDPPVLVVAGQARPRVHGRARVPQDPRVRLLGHVADEELRALYTCARAFCFPSFAEGFGRPPLEAMACGTPAVAAPYGAAREALGDDALIVPLDPERWVAVLRTLDRDAAMRQQVLADARRRAAQLDWDVAAERVREVCVTAAARAPATVL
jgi:glycosyltransferase involved in cell wall biosynthesis